MIIHFIGIGGIGVSALARYYREKGHEVSGSDLASSEITQGLEKLGVKIAIGESSGLNVAPETDLVVYSPAVQEDNAERLRAKELAIPCKSYPECLGELTKQYYTIAISGTHGKSTTTSMIALLLTKAGFDPTVIVGTKVREFGNSNCRVGKSKYLVIEADEHFASFLNYWPKMAVLTTVEEDHLDYYKNLDNIVKTFERYITHLRDDGVLIANGDDKNIEKIIFNSQSAISKDTREGVIYKIQKYSIKQPEAETLRRILEVPGEHNVSNALAALAVARELGIPDETSFTALGEFTGTWRRFEIFQTELDGIPYTLVSDYGHHPTEVKVTVLGAKAKWPDRPLWLVYQPHQYQRTYLLFDAFVEVLASLPIEKLILADIYDVAGREETEIRKKVSSQKLLEAIGKRNLQARDRTVYIADIADIPQYLASHLKGGEVVMVMGAGSIYNLTLHLTNSKKMEKIQ